MAIDETLADGKTIAEIAHGCQARLKLPLAARARKSSSQTRFMAGLSRAELVQIDYGEISGLEQRVGQGNDRFSDRVPAPWMTVIAAIASSPAAMASIVAII